MSPKFKSLFSVLLKSDYRDKERSSRKKLIGTLIAYLVSGSLLTFTYSTIFDEISFTIMSLTASMLLITFIVLNDFDNLFLANRSYDTLITLPVKSTEIFYAKFLSAFLYLMLFFLTIVIPQIIFYRSFDNDLLGVVIFLIKSVLFTFTSAGVFILIYSIILLKAEKLSGILLVILQVFFFLFVVLTASLPAASVGMTRLGIRRSLLENEFVFFTPQYLYATTSGIFGIFLLFAFMMFIYLMVFMVITKKYSVLLEKVNSIKSKSPGKKKSSVNYIDRIAEKLLKHNPQILGSYNLTKWQIKNSKFLKAKYIPIVFLPLVFAIVGFFAGIPGMLIFQPSEMIFQNSLTILSPTISLMMLMSSGILISNTKILDEHSSDTKWIFESLPLENNKAMTNGANFFVYMNYILPAAIVIFIFMMLRTGVEASLLNIVFILSAILFANSIFGLFDKNFPFTFESNKFNSAEKFLEIILSVIVGVTIFIIQIFIFQNIIFVILLSLLFITISFFINRS